LSTICSNILLLTFIHFQRAPSTQWSSLNFSVVFSKIKPIWIAFGCFLTLPGPLHRNSIHIYLHVIQPYKYFLYYLEKKMRKIKKDDILNNFHSYTHFFSLFEIQTMVKTLRSTNFTADKREEILFSFNSRRIKWS
jgi:hypothetical protein